MCEPWCTAAGAGVQRASVVLWHRACMHASCGAVRRACMVRACVPACVQYIVESAVCTAMHRSTCSRVCRREAVGVKREANVRAWHRVLTLSLSRGVPKKSSVALRVYTPGARRGRSVHVRGVQAQVCAAPCARLHGRPPHSPIGARHVAAASASPSASSRSWVCAASSPFRRSSAR